MLEFLKDNYMQHLGYLFTFLALSIKDVLWLRIILALAQLLLGIYQLLENQLEIVFWNAIFTMVWSSQCPSLAPWCSTSEKPRKKKKKV